jgi:callose synthase
MCKFGSTRSFVLIVLCFCRMEVALLLVIFLAYGFNNGGAVGYILLSISSWFMALSWLFAPYLFNPSGFEWQK